MRVCLLLLVSLWSASKDAAYSQSFISAAADFSTFFYAGDQPKLQFVLHNTSLQERTGNLQLELFDAVKKQPVDGWFFNQLANQYFTLAAAERYSVRFPITIPHLFSGKIFWQLTLRIDTTQQLIRGYFDIKDATNVENDEPENALMTKAAIRLLSNNQSSSKPETENPVTPFSTQPIGQPIALRLTINVSEKMDSCIVLLPLSAGLQANGNSVKLKKGKPASLIQQSRSDTAIHLALYQLVPGLYQWDYPFITRYPGEFLVPACRLLFFNATRREFRTDRNSISID